MDGEATHGRKVVGRADARSERGNRSEIHTHTEGEGEGERRAVNHNSCRYWLLVSSLPFHHDFVFSALIDF